MKRIPVAAPDLSGNEEKYVVDAIRSSWISSTGPYVDRFEREFAGVAGTERALAVANGTVALHLALLGLDIGPGDEVLVPSLTYIATANAVRYVGAEPVFVDVDPDTWCMDPAEIEGKITRRTKAIIPVHLYGHPADMDRLNAIAAIHGLWVVEDAAEAVYATYKGRPAGSLGHVATFSFYGNKIITSGEGGAVTLNDAQLYTRLKALRGQGMDPTRRYYFPITGYNFRLTNVACAMLCAQMERGAEIRTRRHAIVDRYEERLKGVDGLGFQPVSPDVEITPWLFCLTVDEAYGRSRDDVMAMLDQAGVETRPFFIPVHRLPPFRHESMARGENLPHTDRIAAAGLNLPTFPGLPDEDIDRICDLLRNGRR